jgi:hypothetical protein
MEKLLTLTTIKLEKYLHPPHFSKHPIPHHQKNNSLKNNPTFLLLETTKFLPSIPPKKKPLVSSHPQKNSLLAIPLKKNTLGKGRNYPSSLPNPKKLF